MNRSFFVLLGTLLLLSCGEPPPPPTPQPSEEELRIAATDWMRQSVVPLSTVEVGHGFADLAPLVPVLANTRVVGLGESTHGTREFFQLKHRMFEFLVSELGFTVFAIEANFTEALAVNRYVLTGEGDPARALAGLYFWTWNTEEVLALIQWMRAYNADPAHTRKLRFHGVDAQYSVGPARAVLEYLALVDPAYRAEVEPWLTKLLSRGELISVDAEAAMARAAGYVTPMRQLRERFEARREQYARAQGEEAFVWAARNARVLEQAVLQHARLGRASANLRDTFMAENARWVLEHEGPEAKMVLWAHDLHLMRENKNYIPLGFHLRDAFGEAFYMFRLAFNQGAFRAVLQPYGGSPENLQTHVIEPAPEKTLEASLASMGQPLLALDLRAAPGEGEVAQYLDGPVQQREIGAAYTPGYPYLINVSPRFAFDGVLFVETTTASRPNPPLPPEAPSGP